MYLCSSADAKNVVKNGKENTIKGVLNDISSAAFINISCLSIWKNHKKRIRTSYNSMGGKTQR